MVPPRNLRNRLLRVLRLDHLAVICLLAAATPAHAEFRATRLGERHSCGGALCLPPLSADQSGGRNHRRHEPPARPLAGHIRGPVKMSVPRREPFAWPCI